MKGKARKRYDYIVTLREVRPKDLPTLFAQQQDPDANWMAAFTAEDPSDRLAFDAHWERILGNPEIITRTIEVDKQVAGSLAYFEMFGRKQVSYWIGRDFWGKGVATQALTLFLAIIDERPIYAQVAADNLGSIRVLAKCGFKIIGEETGYANARSAEITELILKLQT